MKIVAIVCNVVLFVFSGFLLLTEGPSKEAVYVLLAVLLLLVPVMNLVVISGNRATFSRTGIKSITTPADEQSSKGNKPSIFPALKIIAIPLNLVLIGLICWALIDQYPHPDESGFLFYVLVAILTPVISLFTVFYTRKLLKQI